MLARLKSQIFIDKLVFDLRDHSENYIKAVIKDDKGRICSKIETEVVARQKTFCWEGLNDLPYGVYTLELEGAEEAQPVRLVKRV
ncbi:MAG: hypothetical protein H3C48_04495 [Chitinophagaceae bacterium]|nr:hypothetical protein [Chitinophagaceae bacterium]